MGIREYATGRVIAVCLSSLAEIRQYNGGIICGAVWGGPPTLVEGVLATVKIKTPKDIEVWALDNTGRRVRQVAVSVEEDYRVFNIGLECKTIWCEMAVKERIAKSRFVFQ